MTMESRALLGRVIVASTLLALVAVHLPSAASAAVGGALRTLTPNVSPGVPVCDPLLTTGGTSIAIVQGRKLAGVNAVTYPVLLAITCLSSDVNQSSKLNFIDLSAGTVITRIQTKNSSGTVFAPAGGWTHLVHRPDKGDLLGCGSDGTIYSIDFSVLTTTIVDGTVTQLPRPSTLSKSCGGLAWDPVEHMIYQGLTAGSNKIDVARFMDGTTAVLGTVDTVQACTTSGLAITGGALVVACNGSTSMYRFDKNTGAALSPN